MAKNRIVIGCDWDGPVVEDRSYAFVAWLSATIGIGCVERYLLINCFNQATGFTTKKVSEWYEEFKKTSHCPPLRAVPGAHQGLKQLAELYEIHVITARPSTMRSETETEMKRFFPDVPFAAIHMDGWGRKHEHIQACGAKMMIDDNIEQALKTLSFAPTIVFPLPTNQRMPLYPGLTYPRTHQKIQGTEEKEWHSVWRDTWKEIVEKIVPRVIGS